MSAYPSFSGIPGNIGRNAYMQSIGGSTGSCRPPVRWNVMHKGVDMAATFRLPTSSPHAADNVNYDFWDAQGIPPPRTKFSSTMYDNKYVVFGGGMQKAFHNDVYECTLHENGEQKWRCVQRDALRFGGPCPRRSHKSVVRGNEMIFFGGRGIYGRLNDIFVLNLDTYTWSNRTPSYTAGPCPVERAAHSCVLWRDSKMIVFGGDYEERSCKSQGHLNDVWELDLNTYQWRELKTTGDVPPPRLGHEAAISGDTMYIFGGHQMSRLNDLYALNLATGVWRKINHGIQLTPASFMSLAVIPKHPDSPSKPVQNTTNIINHEWPYNGTEFFGASSEARAFILWGGSHPDTNVCSDGLYWFDVEKEQFEELGVCGTKPIPRLGHSLVYHNGKVVLFGGCDHIYFNDLYCLDLSAPSLKEILRHYILSAGINYKAEEKPAPTYCQFSDIEAAECESLCDGSEQLSVSTSSIDILPVQNANVCSSGSQIHIYSTSSSSAPHHT